MQNAKGHSIDHKNITMSKLEDLASNTVNLILRLGLVDIQRHISLSLNKENALKNIMTAVYPNTQTH